MHDRRVALRSFSACHVHHAAHTVEPMRKSGSSSCSIFLARSRFSRLPKSYCKPSTGSMHVSSKTNLGTRSLFGYLLKYARDPRRREYFRDHAPVRRLPLSAVVLAVTPPLAQPEHANVVSCTSPMFMSGPSSSPNSSSAR